jgi:predicted nuclease with TOPRIM domain
MAKEKVVDLKPQNITEEELKNLQDLVNALNRVQIEIGSIESRKHGLLHQVISLQQQMQTLQKGFEELYGKVDINITDGAIAYPEDEQTDKKD